MIFEIQGEVVIVKNLKGGQCNFELLVLLTFSVLLLGIW